ncbi:putative bifunctional diguanylate cyclase/phosphodiesterase [Leptospira ilyithenensis]|uniref:Bifunctional diguanylate cyclase/phosphodiesterase n=1 Tax=Leptospira ilyithenensis TaxID=2484901 RepID=A0A4R9LNH5_9LEPT|nr:bifunctional diguanylate cyclase/phosphodiesterase [Leptospira ilyithenensis]TGN06550.1 bifunctional diguanylate cyclase/phosphodiesterase [Leptospira ilyithenensis]
MRNEAENTSKTLEDSLYPILSQFPNSLQIFNWEGEFISVTERFARSLEYSQKEMVGRSLFDLIHEDDRDQSVDALTDLRDRKTIINFEHRLKTKSGEDVWIMWLAIPLSESQIIIAIDRDITIQKDISFEFILQQQKYKSIFDNLPMGIAITDAKGKIVETNRTARQYFDIQDGEALNRTLNLRKYTLLQPNGSKMYPRNSSLMRALKQKEVIRNMELGLIKDAKVTWFEILATPIPLDNFGLAVAFVDITQRKQAEEKIAYMAFFDQLTNLPNRNSLIDKFFPIFEEARRHENWVGVLAIDIDNFKFINDSRGHEFGDKVVQLMAYRLRESVRSYDLISRQGGDEFTVVLPDLMNERDAGVVCESILDAMNHPFVIEGEQIFVNVSIGVALYPNDGKDSNSLLKNADSALNLAKQQGKSCYVFFTEELQTLVVQRLEIENQMRMALAKDQFTLFFQPKIDLQTYKPIGVEALIRWNHPERGMIPPDVFIPIAEETGMILSIGELVLKLAIQTLRLWREEGIEGISMAVNISTKQFKHEKLISIIAENLRLFRVDAKDLEVEITESSLMDNADAAVKTMKAIRELGATIAIDDFGTGYSSLGYLRRLPISCLKIDRSFVSEITIDKDSDTIVHAVANLAHNLGLSVVAEGAETKEQVERLIVDGIDSVQGFYFSKPLSGPDCIKFLKEKLGISD